MVLGFLTEYISTPKALVDTTVHYRPVGPYEFALWRAGKDLPTPIERYRNDPTALKIISQDQWTLDRPLYDIKATNTVVGAESDYFVQAQRRQNFFRRMVPHVFGWFTMMAAWVIIIVHLEWAKHDLGKITDREIPSWVNGAIYGTVIIFWSFTIPQILFQYLPPGFYWGSELIYCLLSLTAKLYLGIFLLVNVRASSTQYVPLLVTLHFLHLPGDHGRRRRRVRACRGHQLVAQTGANAGCQLATQDECALRQCANSQPTCVSPSV